MKSPLKTVWIVFLLFCCGALVWRCVFLSQSLQHAEDDARKHEADQKAYQDQIQKQQTQDADALTQNISRLENENRQLKEQLAASQSAPQAVPEQASSQTSENSKPRLTIDPEKYKAQLNTMIGWTKQQVAAKFGNPNGTDEGGQYWFYRFNA